MAGSGEVGAEIGTYRRPVARETTASLAAFAALARIEEMGGRMKVDAEKAAARAMWSLGDYHRFAKETVWDVGHVLVEACGITPGQRVLDVAAGSGNAAIRAAGAGAEVVAADLAPENFEAGRREAEDRGVSVTWVEADAEALPFEDAEFDVVTSVFGAMFAPDHRRVADELLRVCRPGGLVAMANFTPDGIGGAFFETLGRHAPPPPAGAPAPTEWGDEEHVRGLFGGRVSSLDLSRRTYVERAASPTAYKAFFEETFGPLIALRASLEGRPGALEALDRDFLEYATSADSGPTGGPAEYRYEYLLVLGRKA
jgi:ubiquinone/menaquinone biosynthesis C-methylase UbiE